MKIILTIMILVFLLTSGCSTEKNDLSADDTQGIAADVDQISAATISRYREGEIKEYMGSRLDPAVGPADNSINGIQYIDIDAYNLKIDGLVDTETIFDYEDILKLDSYERKITLYCVEGWQATILWKGVLIKDILDLAGIQDQAVTVIFRSEDGYTTSLPLDDIIARELILAYEANGIVLPPEMGYPFIVVAEDKLGYKWARWVTEIRLSDDPSYLGFWEQRGFSNSADIGE